MMNDRRSDGQVRPPRAGLCERCVHLEIIRSARDAEFYLCRLSRSDPAFPKYPRIPVVACAGFTPAPSQGLE